MSEANNGNMSNTKTENNMMENLNKELSNILKKAENPYEVKNEINVLSDKFESLLREEISSKKKEFIEGGESEIDFKYNNSIVSEFRNKIKDFRAKVKELREKSRNEELANLNIKEGLLNELRVLLEDNRTPHQIIQKYKEIKNKWFNTGRVPGNNATEINQNFNHHQKRFYEYLEFNREFRDIEFNKNLEEKKAIITKLKEIIDGDVYKIKKEFLKYKKMWIDQIGPVPNEFKDSIWEEFMNISKIIEEKLKSFRDNEKEFEIENLKKKNIILKEIKYLSEKCNNAKQGKDWRFIIKKGEELRNEFLELGKVPADDRKTIWNNFKDTLKDFNNKKNTYFKNLKKESKENIKEKKDLVSKIEEILSSEITNWEEQKNNIIQSQKKWKNIGFIPKKEEQKIWEEFSDKCEEFFKKYNEAKGEEYSTMAENAEKKKAFFEELKSKKDELLKNNPLEEAKEICKKWSNLGKIKPSESKIDSHFNNFIANLLIEQGISKTEISIMRLETKLKNLITNDSLSSTNIMYDELSAIKRKSVTMDADISKLENNLGLFGGNQDISKNPMLRNFVNKIEKLKEEKEILLSKRKLISKFINDLKRKEEQKNNTREENKNTENN